VLAMVCTLLLQVFFDGIESRIAAGVRVEEVGYQLQFSKQELRKVMKEYSGKEVTCYKILYSLLCDWLMV
jgi:Exocyst complex component Sec3